MKKMAVLGVLLVGGQGVFAGGAGLPSRAPDLDVLPGFKVPPPGYGEVPFWWWTGDELDTDRLIGELDALHKKGVSGVQVNYSHHDTPGWLTDQDAPPLFSEAWWTVYQKVAQACAERGMGIGLSTYTLDWPRGATNLFYHLFYSKPELNAIQLEKAGPWRVKGGERLARTVAPDTFAVRAYRVKDGDAQETARGDARPPAGAEGPGGEMPSSRHLPDTRGSLDLGPSLKGGALAWQAPEGEWEVWAFRAARQPGSLNPLMPGAGDTVIRGFFQPFEDRAPNRSSKGLNYFFNDELHVGVEKFAWNSDFAKEFLARKGYDLMQVLPAMWQDLGAITPKVRLDYADVRMALMEERYFKPIYTWHASRGMIFGCDSGGRGLRPNEFGDYFRATRWYSAPGHDTPGGKADLIKGKVSSSIADLYQRPRVWLEGYHSLGWGATPEQLMFATRENYLYGTTLFNLHGLYYSTYGSYWEWAPPCYHFRMPYWRHMDTFLGYFDRLSYLLSQGHLVCDVAVVYPVAPYEAEMDGDAAKNTAFDLARRLFAAGINFAFIDNDSLARAEVEDGLLKVKDAGAAYRALIVPNMKAVRWPTLDKAAVFAAKGGAVYCVGALPEASDRAGRDDPALAALSDRAFAPACRLGSAEQAVAVIRDAFTQDVRGVGQTVRALHRKAGPRDVYLVMDAPPGQVVEFRAKGAVELWDPWTGATAPLRVTAETATGTQVELPLEAYEADVVVFTPGRPHVNPPPADSSPERAKALPGEWTVAFEPTMDNRQGDFRLPVTPENRTIGVEARRFAWAVETDTRTEVYTAREDARPPAKNADMEGEAPSSRPPHSVVWQDKLHGFGTQFLVLGPVPEEADRAALEAELSKRVGVRPCSSASVLGRAPTWQPYDFSWRLGKEGDSGHQGYHGLKRTVTDDFLCLGKPTSGLNETRYVDEAKGARYYLWTCVTVGEPTVVDILVSREPPTDQSHTSPILTPAAVYVNGEAVADVSRGVTLNPGPNPILVRYDHAGRGHFVLRRRDAPVPASRTPLAMRWYDDAGILPFDVLSGARPAEWFRFTTAPGTCAIRVHACGAVEAWLDGVPMKAEARGRFIAARPCTKAAVIALRVRPDRPGITGGALIPEPVLVETDGSGVIALGDWSKAGVLNNYSGGVRYRTTLTLTADEAKARVTLDLGRVAGTAEILVNGRKAGVRVAPPWRLGVTGLLKAGENTFEVLVFNTLANHYQTIPSRYRGDPRSGLLGPVRLLAREWSEVSGSLTSEDAPADSETEQRGDLRFVYTSGAVRLADNTLLAEAKQFSADGKATHAGGGRDFSALFNGTALNSAGQETTVDDGRTFVGFGAGDTLTVTFKKPVTVRAVQTAAGHHDGRASQNYEVWFSTAAAPDRFEKCAAVDRKVESGFNSVTFNRADGRPLAQHVCAVRFLFTNGPIGFNVYREIALLGAPQR